jgi:hypothetical protein
MKFWNGHSFTLVENYKAHDSKISSIGVSEEHIATTTLDRKWSLWDKKNKGRKVKM